VKSPEFRPQFSASAVLCETLAFKYEAMYVKLKTSSVIERR